MIEAYCYYKIHINKINIYIKPVSNVLLTLDF
jgi:hypothetical protein